ncbi:MAG: GC-type dockerin domain-anchored protein [Phycisphaerales bacterium JB039]
MNKAPTAALAALLCAGAATAQTVINAEDFEGGTGGGWLCNGQEMIFPDPVEPSNNYIGVPYADFWGITLRYETPGPVTGDLTRHGGPLTFAVDVQVFRLDNFFGDPLDPGAFPLVLEFVDYPEPGTSDPIASVYHIGPGLPQQFSGWERFVYDVPDPMQSDLPAGWGGTGDEDPVTFEPRLPKGRTWRNVLENVDEVRFTTFVPGFFYTSNFWEMGFDNVLVTVDSAGCYADCDGSGALDLFDFLCFQNAFGAGEPYADCDGSGALDLFDFLCFQNEFAAGCP